MISLVPLMLGLIGVGLAVFAQYQLIDNNPNRSLLFYGIAALLVLVALRRQQMPANSIYAAPPLTLNRGTWTGLGLALTALVVAVTGLPRFAQDSPGLVAWGFHLGSIVLFLTAVHVLNWFMLQRSEGVEEEQPWRPVQIVILVAIVAMGAFLRIQQLDSLPFGTWYDEAEVGLQAIKVLNSTGAWPVFSGAIHGPMHYIYLVALSFQLFGTSTASIRLVSALLGVATILAAYLTGRELFDRRTGLVLAFLIAVSSWAVNFSRIGMHSTATTPLFVLLSVGFLLRGLRRQQLTDYAWAGIFLGLGLNFYTSFRLFIPVVGLFLLHCMIAYRFLLRRSWLGLLILGLSTIIVVAPLAVFAYSQPEIFWARVQDTYLLAGKAPEERIPVLLESIRKHLLMFNYSGDPNGRHNLPGEPMLTPEVAALAALGLVLSLRWIWRPAAMLLPIWLIITLLGGILSLDFEAPQSLRANGALPVAYILAVMPIYGLWKCWNQTRFGRQYPRLFVWPLLALLIYIGYLNYNAYFVRHAQDFSSWNAFSTAETITAHLLQEEGDEAEFYIISFLHGHPTLNFLARDQKGYQRLETTDQLPLRRSADRDIVLITNAESRTLYEQAQRYYPNATFEEIGAPFGGPPVVYYVRLTPQDLAALQGLTGVYYKGEEWSGDSVDVRQDNTIAFDWSTVQPVEGPFSVEWTGVLNIETYGPYRLILRTPAAAELYLDEELLLQGNGEISADIVLAKGNHALRLRAVGGDGALEFAWQAPGRPEEIVPTWALYVPPVSNNGLLGRYFANGDWQPPEAFAQIDPELNFYFHIPLLPRPYTVEWIGKIYIAQAGLYRFGLESIDESMLFINGEEVTASREPNQLREGSINLNEGLHDIRVRYADRTGHTHINLYWTPPGSGQSHIPAQVLFPPQGGYEHIDTEAAEAIFRGQQMPSGTAELPPSSALARTRLPVVADVIPVALERPRAIAVATDGSIVYVADAQQLLILDGEGNVQRRVEEAQEPFQEISDLAVSTEGDLYVLDAGRAQVSVFDADGSYRHEIPTEAIHSGRSRGIFIDAENRIWLANTPNGQLIALDGNGQVLQTLPVSPDVATQPVDLLVTSAGDIYASDVALNRLVQISTQSGTRQAWDIPIANSVDGPHLAMDSAGTLYITAPEQGSILALPANSAEGLEYALPQQRDVPPKVVGIAISSDNSGSRIWTIDSDSSAILSFTPGDP